MNRFLAFAVLLFSAVLCTGQAPAPAPAQASSPSGPADLGPPIVAHGVFPVTITHVLDSGSLNKGDAIEAETGGSFRLPDGKVVPKGSKLLGHVAISSARSKGEDKSELALVFDTVKVQDDGELKIKALVQSVYPPAEESDPGVVNGYTMAADPGIGYVPPDIRNGSNTEAHAKAEIVLDLKFVGIVGMKDLELERVGLLSSPSGQSVKLNKGVRLVVQVIVFG